MAFESSASSIMSYSIHAKNVWGRTIYISDSQNSSTVYKIDTHIRRPHMIFNDTNGTSFATANINNGTNLEFVIRGNEFAIELTSCFTACEFKYPSPSLNGKEVVWKSASAIAAGEIVCSDWNGRKLGRFNQGGLVKHFGTIDLEEDAKLSQEMAEELVVVGTVLAYYRVNQTGMVMGVVSAIV